MIRAITFDLWQTLISEKPEEEEKRRSIRFTRMLAVLNGSGYHATLESLKAAYKASGEWLREVWAEDKDVSTREQVNYIASHLDGKLNLTDPEWGQLVKAYLSPIADIPPVVFPDAIEALQALEDSGYPLGLVCNTGRTPGKALRPILDKMGLGRAFHAMDFSDELKIRKPDPAIFHNVLEKLEVSPGEAVHVGDLAETDVAGAKRTGMLALHLVRDGSAGSPEADGRIQSLAEVTEWVKGR
jgi:putative hydrolase of the HAD superfamily